MDNVDLFLINGKVPAVNRYFGIATAGAIIGKVVYES